MSMVYSNECREGDEMTPKYIAGIHLIRLDGMVSGKLAEIMQNDC